MVESGWCAESYHDAPFIRDQTCNQSSISEHSPLLGATGILVEEYLALWYWLIFLYMWYVYRLAGGTATLMLVHFPAIFSRSWNVMKRLWIASLSMVSSFISFVSGTSNLLRSVSQTMPRKIRRIDGCVVHFFNDMK